MKVNRSVTLLSCLLLLSLFAQAQKQKDNTVLKDEAIADIQNKYDDYKKIALQIWDYAEVGYKEVKSSA